MFRIESKDALIQLFREIDQPKVEIPNSFHFPIGLSDSLSWMEASGHRSFLIFQTATMDRPVGLSFEQTKATTDVPSMCQWCHSVRPVSDVTLMTVRLSHNHTIGLYLCSDLNCKERIVLPSVNDLRETLNIKEKQLRLMEKVEKFVFQQVF